METDPKIVIWPDPRLKRVSEPIQQITPEIRELAVRMLELMREARGVGLAAPQVGVNLRLFVMNATGEPGDNRVYINPELGEPAGEETSEEGCLSLPGINVQVSRSRGMRMKALDLDGAHIDQVENGYVARIWQHEYDHLNGVLITDRMGLGDRLRYRKALRELEEKYAVEHPAPPAPVKKTPPKRAAASQGLMKLIFAGSGEFGVPSLRALIDGGHDVSLVVSQPDRPAGRGRHLTPTPISQFAADRNLPILKTADINQESLQPADLMIVIAFGQKIAPSHVNHARLGSINLHGSRLPRWRGAAPVNWAIIAGDATTGNSIIRLATRMDAGAVLAQSELAIGALETAGELHDRLALDGAVLLPRLVEEMDAGQFSEMVQDESRVTHASKLNRLSSHLDWSKDARAIASQIRGMYPWPACHVRLLDEAGKEMCRAELVRARPADDEGAVGTILESGAVATGRGSVEIVEIKPDGKRPMPLTAFRNGHPWHAGMRIESL